MESKETDKNSGNDRAEQDIRAGFSFLRLLRVTLDRATSLIATFHNEEDKSMSESLSSYKHSIRQFLESMNELSHSRYSSTEGTVKNELLKHRQSSASKTARSRPQGLPSASSTARSRPQGFHSAYSTAKPRAQGLPSASSTAKPRPQGKKSSLSTSKSTIRLSMLDDLPHRSWKWPGTTTSSLPGDSAMTKPSLTSGIQALQTCLDTVKDVLSNMEAKVAGPIYWYLPIVGCQDDKLLVKAMDIERNLDMLEYKLVQKRQNDAIKIINGLKPMLESILTVLIDTFEELTANLITQRAIQKADDSTILCSMPNPENIINKPASPSVEVKIPSRVKETLEMQLLEKGQDGIYLVPILISSESQDYVIRIQDIYKNSRVKEHFDVRIWVNVSSGSTMITSKVSVPRCINELMNAHVMNSSNHLPPVHSKEFETWINQDRIAVDSREAHEQNMKDLEEVIQCGLAGRKFVLVLHGISEDKMGQVEHLLRLIKSGRKGSKIIMLTTSTNVEESVRNINIMRSDEIENNLSWRFFRIYAFDNLDIDGYQMELGIQITTLLRPFPIAMKMIGYMLKHNPFKTFWESVYQNIFQIVIDGKEAADRRQLLSLLKLCYDQLPARVGLCFNYCSLYPKDWRFTAQSLIHIWMSDGITEDIGKNYFSCLCSRGFFDLLKLQGGTSTSCYVMHSAIHHLAEVVSAKRFRRVESKYLPANPQLMTHMSIMSGSLPTLHNLRWQITELNLRTLIVFGPSECTEARSKEILDEFLKGQKNLRALDLHGFVMQKLPKLSNNSRHHLRYLSLQDTGIETLENFDKFYHLLVLNVQGCQLRSLPDNTSQELLRVRHIIGPASLVSLIHCIGNLKNLQELHEFRVRKLPGYGIEELQHMNLRGSLSITNLENITIVAKAEEVNLSLKTSLVSLKLEWHSTEETSRFKSEEVLERLRPPYSLNELEINGYPGINSPTWFTEDHLINMKKVTLRNCFFMSVFAPLAKLPNLKELTLERLSMLKKIYGSDWPHCSQYASCRFPAMVKLCITDMPLLEEWTEEEPCFPCLEEFTVRNCPKLTVLPRLHARVKKIRIEGVQLRSFDSPWMESHISSGKILDVSDRSPNTVQHRAMQRSKTFILRYCPNLSTIRIPDDNNSSSSHCLGPLLQLELTECKELKAIEGALGIVEKLHIEKCHGSLKLPDGHAMQSLHTLHIDSVSERMDPFLLGLQSLRVLIIKDSAELSSLDMLLASDQLLKTLEQLQLINCNSIESLPRYVDQFLALESLHLLNCPNMLSLPCLPSNLTELRISDCPILKEKYGYYGPEWDNISHVPYVSVD